MGKKNAFLYFSWLTTVFRKLILIKQRHSTTIQAVSFFMVINPTFRYPPKPSVPALVHVRSFGHYRIPEPVWHDKKAQKNFLQMFWGIRGSAVLRHHGKKYTLEPENVCFYLPGDIHDISIQSTPLEYCWLTFDGDNLEHLIQCFNITRTPFHAGPCPLEIFQSLDLNLHNYAPYGEYLASADGYKILCLAFAGEPQETTLSARFKLLVEENLADPELHPAQLAATLNIHPTTLNRNISAATGMTPIEYLTAIRLQQALTLIRTTSRSFKEIAEECGFANANYFAKVFRKKFGCSPSGFRQGAEPAEDH